MGTPGGTGSQKTRETVPSERKYIGVNANNVSFNNFQNAVGRRKNML